MTYRECFSEALRRLKIPPQSVNHLIERIDKEEPVGAHQSHKEQRICTDEEMVQYCMELIRNPSIARQGQIMAKKHQQKN